MKHEKKRKRWPLMMVLFSCCMTGCAILPSFGSTQPGGSSGIIKEQETTVMGESHTSVEEIFVHICGCVKDAGLYTLPAGTRAGDAVEAAGGFTKKADKSAVNLASVLEDGMQLYIPSLDESADTEAQRAQSKTGSDGKKEVSAGLVNINEATAQELTSLSGIGLARAENIVSYREENGPFSSIEDIKNVSGIGDGIFEKIKDSITV